MKAAFVVVLVAMVAAVSARECDILARLNVKSQWMRAYSHGHDREHFAEAIWRAYVASLYVGLLLPLVLFLQNSLHQ